MIPLREALINKGNEGNAAASGQKRSPFEVLRDPTTWCVDDFIYITYNYNACLPVFYKIESKKGKVSFLIREYRSKVTSGAYNSPSGYYVVPDGSSPIGETKQVRISRGVVRIDKNIATKWNGEPVHGYSD